MSEIKVSVIMPVYNSQDYLEKCLDSVCAQSLREIEIICVDDGSTDRSGQILDEYARKDSRLRVLHQKNQFAGVARNNGMARARGKYLVFWDSDDLFKKNALKKMYDRCEKDHAQICVCGARKLDMQLKVRYTDTTCLDQSRLPSARPFSVKDIPGTIFNFAGNVPWNKMYLRAFVEEEHLLFQDQRQANDIYFVMTSLLLADRITTVSQKLIIYRCATGSGLTAGIDRTPYCWSEAFKKVWETMNQVLDHSERFPDPQIREQVRQSFRNKVVGGLFYGWRSLHKGDTAQEVFLYYQSYLFPLFKMYDHPPDYWYSRLSYERVEEVRGMDAGSVMLRELQYFSQRYVAMSSLTAGLRKAASCGRKAARVLFHRQNSRR